MVKYDIYDEYLISNEFNIQTPAIFELQKSITNWISNGVPGAIIYGRPRIGKTRAILYISAALRALYGRELPIYILNAVEYTKSDRYFYSELLKSVGHIECERGTATVLKNRLINALLASACNSKYRKIILFIDEAYNLSEREYKWLMDIYNNLNLQDIRLYVFLVGTEELLARKQALIMTQQHQIVGRFMVEEFHFKGIQTAKEMAACLFNYDTPLLIDGQMISLTKCFFPEAYNDKRYLISCADVLMEQYIRIMKEIGIPVNSEIPMMYFTNAVKYCLKKYGKEGENVYFPEEKEWYDSIMNSGYIAAERIYYNVSFR